MFRFLFSIRRPRRTVFEPCFAELHDIKYALMRVWSFNLDNVTKFCICVNLKLVQVECSPWLRTVDHSAHGSDCGRFFWQSNKAVLTFENVDFHTAKPPAYEIDQTDGQCNMSVCVCVTALAVASIWLTRTCLNRNGTAVSMDLSGRIRQRKRSSRMRNEKRNIWLPNR